MTYGGEKLGIRHWQSSARGYIDSIGFGHKACYKTIEFLMQRGATINPGGNGALATNRVMEVVRTKGNFRIPELIKPAHGM